MVAVGGGAAPEGDDGEPVRFIGVVVDVTERREAQRAVEYNHGRRAALLEARPLMALAENAERDDGEIIGSRLPRIG